MSVRLLAPAVFKLRVRVYFRNVLSHRSLHRLTIATICGDLGWHEEIHEETADHYRTGDGRLLVFIVWLASRPEEPNQLVFIEEQISDTPRGPAFEVRVVVPRMARPLGGILPDWVVKKMDGTPSELRFDHTSSGAQVGSVGPDRLELRADGWDLLIETDGEGRVAPGTHIVFPLALGGRHLRLDCRPADRASGALRTTKGAGSDEFDGRFLVFVTACKNAQSGKLTNWPSRPLTLRGRFQGLPPGHRLTPANDLR